jgi:hypothetical protein
MRSTGENMMMLSLTVQQDRRERNLVFSSRIQGAREIGMRALRGPARFGDGFSVKDDDGTLYEPDESVQELIECREKANELATAIAARGFGRAKAVSLGLQLSRRNGNSEWWLKGLGRV